MSADEKPTLSNEITRRKFIAVAAGTAGAMLINPSVVRGTGANSAVRVRAGSKLDRSWR